MTEIFAGGDVPPARSCSAQSRVPLYGPDFAADPARFYAELRQRGPIAAVELAPGVPAMLVVSYEIAIKVLRNSYTFPRDPRNWQRTAPRDSPVFPLMGYRPMCLFTDGQTHARLRKAVTDSLARVDRNAMRAYVERGADVLIEQFGPVGQADLLTQYARSLPLMVVGDMFGCPATLGDRMLGNMSRVFDGVDVEQSNADLNQCLAELIALKRRQPGEDVTSWLMAHPAQLNDEEMAHQLVQVMGAVAEPERNLIANTLRLLLVDKRFGHGLAGGTVSVRDALDEVLWTDPPMANKGIAYPVRDLDVAGIRLPAHQPVVISFAAANNDPLLVANKRAGNRAHLAFGLGTHACPAQSHAHLIASIAIEKILDAFPDIQLSVPAQNLQWRPGPFHRALSSLPVRFTPVPIPAPPSKQSPQDTNPDPATSAPPPVTSTPGPAILRQGWNILVNWWHGQ